MEKLTTLQGDINRLWKSGVSRVDITKRLGCSIHTVNRVCKGRHKACNETRALVVCLRMDGYYIDEVCSILGMKRDIVIYYSKGVKFENSTRPSRSQKPKVMKIKKKLKEPKITAEEQRALLNTGAEAGATTLECKLNPSRDDGRLVLVRYKGLGGVQTCEIRVRDGVSDQEARERWCKKYGKELVV